MLLAILANSLDTWLHVCVLKLILALHLVCRGFSCFSGDPKGHKFNMKIRLSGLRLPPPKQPPQAAAAAGGYSSTALQVCG